ncbi:DUF2470 domain-containing protein [Cysteiniphilum sp. QT6929]|uniref:HugZ family pyridoxamine 5'-phosphate oxidase n=1 Tax=Cysteiniphilum sp. QT6929 TaxID=2975055 RepID=UPI0024B3B7F5|nr:DUF2470 domain-containing protein [Cysteiniphilum sp. QT6929]WHN66037.1 DUF2470 domain-containing protein [Cysteiniphilum sp. QT6929]
METNKVETALRARQLTKQKLYGVLATQSVAMPGYPFGSLVAYAFDTDGEVLVYISKLAQHTRNVAKDDKVSLTIIEDEKEDIQQAGRVTILGRLNRLEDEEKVASVYTRFFPESKDYQDKTHDFHFYKLHIEKVRFIGGFGDINWVNKENFCIEQVFKDDEINGAIKHMNEDHKDALALYCQCAGIALTEDSSLEMVYFDQEGMWLQSKYKNHYIPFDHDVTNLSMLRAVLAAMSKKARQQIASNEEALMEKAV